MSRGVAVEVCQGCGHGGVSRVWTWRCVKVWRCVKGVVMEVCQGCGHGGVSRGVFVVFLRSCDNEDDIYVPSFVSVQYDRKYYDRYLKNLFLNQKRSSLVCCIFTVTTLCLRI